ncbi:MAG TPA: hypothetical protein VGM39_22735 [Kofleriaceae bacterium]
MAIALTCVAACGGGGGATSGDDDSPIDGGSGSDAGSGDGPVSTSSFSFFVTSLKGLQDLSGNQLGFGGDLRFGETGDENSGAGLRGADKICAALAEKSLAGAGGKTWHAFLSFSNDGSGNAVNAIDRIGNGPWYDRNGKMLADTLANIKNTRPLGGDASIKNDFPNENGVPNHDPDGTGDVDNHDMLTGSTTTGTLYAGKSNCLNWTGGTGNKTTEGQPRVGHSWPRGGGGGPGGMDAWMSSLTESGCAPGVNLVEMGGPMASSNTVGSGGGYGGFYCFAIN